MPIAFDSLTAVLTNYLMATAGEIGYPALYRNGPFTVLDFPLVLTVIQGQNYPLIACRLSAVRFAKMFCSQLSPHVGNPGPLYLASQMHQMIVSSPMGNITVWPKYVALSNTIFTPMSPVNFMNNHLFPAYKA